jgi:hypothetical protein
MVQIASTLFHVYAEDEVAPCDLAYVDYKQTNTIASDTQPVSEKIEITVMANSKNEVCKIRHVAWLLSGVHINVSATALRHTSSLKRPIETQRSENLTTQVLSQYKFGPKSVAIEISKIFSGDKISITIDSEVLSSSIEVGDLAFLAWLPNAVGSDLLKITHILKVKDEIQGKPYHLGLNLYQNELQQGYKVFMSHAISIKERMPDCLLSQNNFDKQACTQMLNTNAVGWSSYKDYSHIAEKYLDQVERSLGKNIKPTVSNPNLSQREIQSIVAKEIVSARNTLRYSDAPSTSNLIYQLRPIDQIISSGQGVCREYTTLLISKLLAYGIAAHPVLVNIRNKDMWIPEIPIPIFDHVVVYVPSLDIYVDPTDTTISPLSLHSAMVGRVALNVVDKSLSRIRLGSAQIPDIINKWTAK